MYSPHVRPTSALWNFVCVGTLAESLLHVATLDSEEMFDQLVFMPVKPFAPALVPCKESASP